MQFNKRFIFLLERILLVVFFLVFDVLKYLINRRFRNRISGIAGLPGKFVVNEVVCIYVMGAAAFYLFYHIGYGFLRAQ